jgi:uncharacterized phage-associated protein
MTVENKKLKMAIYYLVKNLGTRLTKTKLMKLLFISDYIAKNGKRLGIGKSITGIRYIYYHYGPFSFEVYPSIEEMDGHEIEEIDLSDESEHGSLFTYQLGRGSPPNVEFNNDEKRILDFVVQRYGYLSLGELLTIVYESKVMKRANMNDVLLE